MDRTTGSTVAVLIISSLYRVSLHARLALLRCMAPADSLLLVWQADILLTVVISQESTSSGNARQPYLP